MAELADFNPTLVADCFNCVGVVSTDTVITQGLERLATFSAAEVRTFAHLSAVDPMSRVLADIHQCYIRVLPPEIRSNNPPISRTFCALRYSFHRHQRYWWIQQRISGPSGQERTVVTLSLSWPNLRDMFPDPTSSTPDLNHRGLPINRCDRPEL